MRPGGAGGSHFFSRSTGRISALPDGACSVPSPPLVRRGFFCHRRQFRRRRQMRNCPDAHLCDDCLADFSIDDDLSLPFNAPTAPRVLIITGIPRPAADDDGRFPSVRCAPNTRILLPVAIMPADAARIAAELSLLAAMGFSRW